MSKRIRIYTASDVAQHDSASSCWVSHRGRVYDVTGFLADHPGGDDLLLKYAGRDVENVMKDPQEHDHSDSAYAMLEEFIIGRVGAGEELVHDDWEPTDDFHPENTDEDRDFERNQFLDLRRPLLEQMWYANFSKAYYLQQVHQPRHLAKSARLFGPDILEVFTRTAWYVVPTIWLPIATYVGLRSLLQFAGFVLPSFTSHPALPLHALSTLPTDAYIKFAVTFLTGNIIWTILEYTLHRFLFHVDEYLPDRPAFLTLHFLLHGVHHYLPMDALRLVMPPAMFTALSFPFTRLAHALFPASVANGLISGAFAFYVVYDCMHYAMHHTKLPTYMREMKKYHLAHHYKNFELGFGVTSKIWDIVFNTLIPM
ncbi:hypothetical protein EVG20_g8489 [Dentipellis fragilis]|uniref:Ceramide very long chain fatty acid hydroxylase n=1 Tax=Dentipellis fragilis TaxID=205917 RepID=A0A4Y9Y6B2_9AGAM|nr:hypothetical protein EVG20_g8489 [Dentipellis fragilis]